MTVSTHTGKAGELAQTALTLLRHYLGGRRGLPWLPPASACI
jgi:hypothetical protein